MQSGLREKTQGGVIFIQQFGIQGPLIRLFLKSAADSHGSQPSKRPWRYRPPGYGFIWIPPECLVDLLNNRIDGIHGLLPFIKPFQNFSARMD